MYIYIYISPIAMESHFSATILINCEWKKCSLNYTRQDKKKDLITLNGLIIFNLIWESLLVILDLTSFVAHFKLMCTKYSVQNNFFFKIEKNQFLLYCCYVLVTIFLLYISVNMKNCIIIIIIIYSMRLILCICI